MKLIKGMMLVTALSGALALTGCDEGPAESAGEKIDNAAEKTGDAVKDAADEVKDAVDK